MKKKSVKERPVKAGKTRYMRIVPNCLPQEITVNSSQDGEQIFVDSTSLKAETFGEGVWSFEFKFDTAFGKHKIKLGYCEMDEIALALRLWKATDPAWFCRTPTVLTELKEVE